jgi:hypothetical protein
MITPEDRRTMINLINAVWDKVEKSNLTSIDKTTISQQLNMVVDIAEKVVKS